MGDVVSAEVGEDVSSIDVGADEGSDEGSDVGSRVG